MSHAAQQTPALSANANGVGSGDWFGAVSIVLTMHKENGRLNIWNELSQVRASTRDAAIGFAVREALKRNPEHQVHCLTATEFSPPNNELTREAANKS